MTDLTSVTAKSMVPWRPNNEFSVSRAVMSQRKMRGLSSGVSDVCLSGADRRSSLVEYLRELVMKGAAI